MLSRKSAGLLAQSLAEFERTAASERRLLFSPMDFDAERLSRQEANRGFISSCAAMKCGLAISQNFNERRARAAHSDRASLAR